VPRKKLGAPGCLIGIRRRQGRHGLGVTEHGPRTLDKRIPLAILIGYGVGDFRGCAGRLAHGEGVVRSRYATSVEGLGHRRFLMVRTSDNTAPPGRL
jgi:hypothetical protein